MDATKKTLVCYTCSCCKESYSDKEDAERCCSGLYAIEQEEIWERRLDLTHSSIPICPHH